MIPWCVFTPKLESTDMKILVVIEISVLVLCTLFASFSDCYNVVIFPQVKCHRYWPNTEDQPVVYTERLVYAVSATAAN